MTDRDLLQQAKHHKNAFLLCVAASVFPALLSLFYRGFFGQELAGMFQSGFFVFLVFWLVALILLYALYHLILFMLTTRRIGQVMEVQEE